MRSEEWRSNGAMERRSKFIKQICLKQITGGNGAPPLCNSQYPMVRPSPLTCCPCVTATLTCCTLQRYNPRDLRLTGAMTNSPLVLVFSTPHRQKGRHWWEWQHQRHVARPWRKRHWWWRHAWRLRRKTAPLRNMFRNNPFGE